MEPAVNLARIERGGRSVITLNRDREFSILRRMLDLAPGDELVDFGSGDGFWTVRFGGACAAVTGLEPDGRLIAYARALHPRPNVEYREGFAEKLPFADASFDKVVSISCLEHFADPLAGLREMARVLKPAGRLAISVDSLLPANSPASFREWHRRRHFVTRYFDETTLHEMLESVGLACERDRTTHLFRSRVGAELRRRFIRHPRPLLPLFPLLYGAVRIADWAANDMHGQIIAVTATRRTG
jgi:ubiquinone/menaquinone biosynthesis C-methylase UbiE